MMRRVIASVCLWITFFWIGLSATSAVADQNGSASALELSAEVLALRSDVRELRADIRRLIEHLQVDQAALAHEEASQSTNTSIRDKQQIGREKTEFVDLPLKDCIATALENTELEDTEINRLNLRKSVHDAYWDLWVATKQFEVLRKARDSALEVWRLSADRTKIGAKYVDTEAPARALYKQFESQISEVLYGSTVPGKDPQGMYGRENLLRDTIGWAAADGRMIRPTDEPSLAPAQLDFEQVREEALRNNPTVRKKKSDLAQLELELTSAKKTVLPHVDMGDFNRWLGAVAEEARTITNNKLQLRIYSGEIAELTADDYQEIGVQIEFSPEVEESRRTLSRIRSLQIQLVSRQEQLREAEMFVVDNITTQWRNLEATFAAINDFRDQLQTNLDEIKIYHDQIDRGDLRFGQFADLLLRAEERRARSESQYFQAIGQYRKAIAAIHWWCGSSSLADAGNQKSEGTQQSIENEQLHQLSKAISNILTIDSSTLMTSVDLGTKPKLSCKIQIHGQRGAPLPNEVLEQIVDAAVETIAGLQRSDVSVIYLGRESDAPIESSADNLNR